MVVLGHLNSYMFIYATDLDVLCNEGHAASCTQAVKGEIGFSRFIQCSTTMSTEFAIQYLCQVRGTLTH